MTHEPTLLQSTTLPGAVAIAGIDANEAADDDASISWNNEYEYVCPYCQGRGSGPSPSLAVTEATVVDDSSTSIEIPVVMGTPIVKRRMLRSVGKNVRRLPKLIKSIRMRSLPKRRGRPKDDTSSTTSLVTPSDDSISTLTQSFGAEVVNSLALPTTRELAAPPVEPNPSQVEIQEQRLVHQENTVLSSEKLELAYRTNAREHECSTVARHPYAKTLSDGTTIVIEPEDASRGDDSSSVIANSLKGESSSQASAKSTLIIPDETNLEWFEPPAPLFRLSDPFDIVSHSPVVAALHTPDANIGARALFSMPQGYDVDEVSEAGSLETLEPRQYGYVGTTTLARTTGGEPPLRHQSHREELHDESTDEVFPPTRSPLDYGANASNPSCVDMVDPCDGTTITQTSLSEQPTNDYHEIVQIQSRSSSTDLQENHGPPSTEVNGPIFGQPTPVVVSLPLRESHHSTSRQEAVVAPVPLSTASVTDDAVYNDTLKVVMLGGNAAQKSWLAHAIQGTDGSFQSRSALGVNVLPWLPSDTANSSVSAISELPVNFKIWDVHGDTICNDVDSGVHPGTQSLFFSASSLYLLTWDLAFENRNTYQMEDSDDMVTNLQAHLALQEDISTRVLPWVDCIARCGSESAILPVGVAPDGMKDSEVKRRCDMMLKLLAEHTLRLAANKAMPKLITDFDSVSCVSHGDASGIARLRETLVAAAEGRLGCGFDHIISPVPKGTMLVREAIGQFRRNNHKIIELNMLNKELGPSLQKEDVSRALCFLSSIGEIMYFGAPDDTKDVGDEILSRFVVLCNQWLIRAAASIPKENIKQTVTDACHTVNMFGINTGQGLTTNQVTEELIGSGSWSCPLLSSSDARLLWICSDSVREAADRCCSQMGSTDASMALYRFLEKVFVRAGVFLPLVGTPPHPSPNLSELFLVSGCLSEPADWEQLWTYKTKESWKTTLCHSLPLPHGISPDAIEQITVNLLRDLSEFSRRFQGIPPATYASETASVFSFSSDDSDERSLDPVGPVKIHQVMCWKSCLMVKIGMVYEDRQSREPRESFVEILIAVVDRNSTHCVGSGSFETSTQHVTISSKGEVGHQGQKIWKGGLRAVLDSVLSTIASITVDNTAGCLAICPECLAHLDPREASSFIHDKVKVMANTTDPGVWCERGHRVDSRLLTGTTVTAEEPSQDESMVPREAEKRVLDIAPSVVMIGVWNPEIKKLCCVGSGFVADANRGLVVTAAHVLFCMDEGPKFGYRYAGTVVIGVIPPGQTHCQFSYVADVVSADVCNVDACVLRIRSKIANGMNVAGPRCADQLASYLNKGYVPNKEKLLPLRMTQRYELEQTVRIIGFNQGGEGVFKSSQLERVDQFIGCAKGHICKSYHASALFNNGFSWTMESQKAFEPRQEVVVERCRTIGGHSGGPCVNGKGEVVGILSRSDPADPQRCYVVPSTELIGLMSQAKRKCAS